MRLKPFDPNGEFCPCESGGGLRRTAVRSAGVTVLAQALVFAIQMIAMIALARLLTPSDFGVLTMVTTFSLLLANFGLNGFTEAVVQREGMNHALASNLFWVNVAGSLVLAIGFAGIAPMLARFYKDARVAGVAEAMSLTILFTGPSVLHLALLKRAMRFSAVSVNDILARTVSVVVSLVLVWLGWGYWGLVAGAVALPLSTCLGAWALCGWMPGLPRRAAGTRSVIKSATHIYGFFAFHYGARNIDNLLVGWRFGPSSLGFYKKAYDLFVLPANQLLFPIASVAVPTLSQLANDAERHRRYLLRSIAILAFIGMGVGACLTVIGRDLVVLLLGSKWEQSGRIFTFFGPGIGAMFLYGAWGWIHLSIGTVDRYFRWGFVEISVTGLAFLLALRWGPVGIAIAWTASLWILTIPAYWYAGRPIRLGIRSVIAVVWPYVLASALAGGASAYIVREMLSRLSMSVLVGTATRIVTTGLLFGLLYLVAIVLLHGGYEPLLQIVWLLREQGPQKWFNRSSLAVATTGGTNEVH